MFLICMVPPTIPFFVSQQSTRQYDPSRYVKYVNIIMNSNNGGLISGE